MAHLLSQELNHESDNMVEVELTYEDVLSQELNHESDNIPEALTTAALRAKSERY